MANNAIEAVGLTKTYGQHLAVDNLTFAVNRGSVTGFLGQNGAGKSSTIKMLLGMVRPTAGKGQMLGRDIADAAESIELRRRMAYVAEDKRLYDYMTVRQLIDFTRAFYPGWRTDVEKELLDEFRLPTNRPLRKFSKGMRTQAALLLAFARDAELLILDEPTEGLDPIVTEKVLSLVVSAAAAGTTVFFSSHQVAEVEQVADHVLMLHKGRLVLDTSLDEVKEGFRRIQLVLDEPLDLDLGKLAGVKRFRSEGRLVSILASHNVRGIVATVSDRSSANVNVLPVTLKEVLLETIEAQRA
jgi:ABC-2 type transport system ATP-binding protein